MSRAVVTGGAGGIGLYLSRRLVDLGHSVDVIDDFSSSSRDQELDEFVELPLVRLVEGDLRTISDSAFTAGAYDTLYHMAARVGVARARRDPEGVLVANIGSTVAALGLARSLGVGRFVFASSSEVYGGSLAAGILAFPTPEDAMLVVPDLGEPRYSYMLSKLCGEALTRYSGVPWTILRYHNVYGPRMGHSHVIPELIGRALSSSPTMPLRVSSAEHRRTFCFVTDAVEYTIRAGESPDCETQILNVGSAGPEIRIGDLAERILRTVGRKAEILAQQAAPDDPPRRRPDMAKTEKLTGYRSIVNLDEGLATTVDWYRNRALHDV